MSDKEQQLKKLVEDLYIKLQAGLNPETFKVELKRQWYDLKKRKDNATYKINSSKFLKEICALANTYGPTAHMIIGLGEDGIITDSPFTNAGLNDKTELYNLVVKFVDKPIRFENHEIITDIDGTSKTISVLVIPPSVDKPHVMSEYVTEKQTIQNFTPVKKDTGIFPATRTDFDLMYYDNQNIIPEYALDIRTFGLFQVTLQPPNTAIHLPVVFENYGRKPVVLIQCYLRIFANKTKSISGDLIFPLNEYYVNNGLVNQSSLQQRPIIIPSNNAITFVCIFLNRNSSFQSILQSLRFQFCFESQDAAGNNYKTETFQR